MTERESILSFRRKDFRVDRIRGSGPGGQHRNKTESCVRITHIASGLAAFCCEQRDQHRNFKIAFHKLAKLLVAHYVQTEQRQRYAAGHERIRTYHEPDDRVTCHKTGNKFSYRETVGRGDIEPLILDAITSEPN